MASNTTYHRAPDNNRISMDSSPRNSNSVHDEGDLLLDPTDSDDDDNPDPPKKEHKFSCHPTLILRILTICMLVTSLALYGGVVEHRPNCLSAIIFISLIILRNLIIIIHYIFSKWVRVRVQVEFRNQLSASGRKPKRKCPSWVQSGPIHLLLDLVLAGLLLIATVGSGKGSYRWSSRTVVPAMVLAYIGNVFYLLSSLDMGRPSNITVTGGISFDYGKGKKDTKPQLAQVYRDVEVEGAEGPSGDAQGGKGISESMIVV